MIEKGGAASLIGAGALFFFGGLLAEFWWFALAYCVAAWWYCKSPSKLALVSWIAAAASLYAVNRNLWALAALPVIFIAPRIDLKMPRIRYAFYVYYPAHLAVLLSIKLMFY